MSHKELLALLIQCESEIERARDRFRHIAEDTAPNSYMGGHERVCFNATCGRKDLDVLVSRISAVRITVAAELAAAV